MKRAAILSAWVAILLLTVSCFGRRYSNLEPTGRNGLIDIVRWQLTRDAGTWRKSEAGAGPRPPASVSGGSLRVTYVNHATVLVQMDGINILTDPIWTKRVSPIKWIGPARYRAPGIRWEDLPPIHLVLVSHNHYDHMDLATLRRLATEHRPRVYAGLGNRRALERAGVALAAELDWWGSAEVAPKLRLTAVPARHWSGRKLVDRDKTLWCGFVLEGPSGSVYFAGDTAWGIHFAQIAERFPRLRAAILPIGSYRPRWFMAKSHLSPDEAVRAHRVLKPAASVAMHYGTFRLADDAQHEPLDDLRAALDRERPPTPFLALDFGEGRDLPR